SASTRLRTTSLTARALFPFLHSFPTRRSSDLADSVGRHGGRRAGRRLDQLARPVRQRLFAGDRVARQVGPGDEAEPRLDRASWSDRKSTRLNSSHVAISYAVFCLKNKNVHET